MIATYAYTPISFAGTTLSTFASGAYFTFVNGPAVTGARQPVEASVPGLGTRDVRGQAVAQTWELHINLKDLTEATYAAFLACFNEESGQGALIANDGSAGAWTVQARVISIQGTNSVQFIVVLRVADPRWTQTGGTSSQLAQSATFGPFTLANTGNRQARPAITITAKAAKTGVADDFGRQLQGFIVNRAPYDWTNKPVCLFDVEGAASRINTAGLCTAAGDDIRVWLDDVPDYPRWLVTPNAAGTEVWINVTMPAAIPLTLVAAMTNVSPAAGQSFVVNEDISRLPQKGFVAVIKEGANASEVIYFNSRAGRTLLGIQRAQWGTTAGAHALGASCYPNPKHYVVGTSFSNILTSAYGPPPAPSAQRPCIQLPGSSNQTWKWGDETDDASTIYFDRTKPDRTAQWVPGFDLDGNAISPLMSLSASGTILTFKDDVPGDGNPPYNYVEQFFPQGIKASDATAITNDWTPASEILNLELFVRDAGGNLKIIDQLRQAASAAGRTLASSAGAPSGLAAPGYGVKLKGRNAASGGNHRDISGGDLVIASNTADFNGLGLPIANMGAIGFIVPSGRTKTVAFRLRNGTAAVTQVVAIEIWSDAGNAPSVGLYRFANVSLTSTIEVSMELTLPPYLTSAGGRYWIVVGRRTPFNSPVLMYFDSTGPSNSYTHPSVLSSVYGGSSWGVAARTTIPYLISYSDYDNNGGAAFSANETPLLNTSTGARIGTTASFDKTGLTWSTSQSPYVHRTGTFAQTLLHLAGTLSSSTTGKTIAFDKWMTVTATLALDCDARTVIYTEVGVAIPMAKACTFSDTADWLSLNPGNNALTYSEASLAAPGQLDLVAVWSQVKV